MLHALLLASASQFPDWYTSTCPGSTVSQPVASYGVGSTHVDVAYGTAHERQKLDVFLSAAATAASPAPLVVYVHGGSWSGGDKGRVQDEILALRAYGFSVASVGYRLSGQAIYPAQPEYVRAAIVYLKANAGTYFFDPEKLVLTGTSAGGHLAALVGLDPQPELGGGDSVAAVVNFFGPSLIYGSENTEGAVHGLLGCTPVESDAACYATAVEASPITHVGAGKPPLLMMHGTDDTTVVVDSSVLMQAAAVNAQMDSTLVTVDGVGHSIGRILRDHAPSPSPDGNMAVLTLWMAQRLAGCGPRTGPPRQVSDAELSAALTSLPSVDSSAALGGGAAGRSRSLSPRAVIGIGVGVGVGVLLLVALLSWYWCRRRRRGRDDVKSKGADTNTSTYASAVPAEAAAEAV